VVNVVKKVLAIVLLCAMVATVCAFGITSCGVSTPLGDSKMADNYTSVDDLIKDSPVIVVGTVDSTNSEFSWGEVPFALTKFKIETAIRGTVPATINILQTKSSDDPFLQKGNRMVLFLVKYTGPVTEDAYRMKGLYQGQYTIKGTKIVKNGENKLTGDEILANLDKLTARVDLLGYVPKPTAVLSK
jgi:hypothetical protein